MLTKFAVPVLLGLCGITLVTALLALSSWMASLTNDKDVKNRYLSKLWAGAAYVCLGLTGIIATFFMDEKRLLSYILAWLFMIMGGFVFRSGWRLRKATITRS